MSSILTSSARSAGNFGLLASPSTPVLPGDRTAGPVYQVFPEVAYGAINERVIHNPNASGVIWVTTLDEVTPAANGEGSIGLDPGETLTLNTINEVRAVFSAGAMAITAFER